MTTMKRATVSSDMLNCGRSLEHAAGQLKADLALARNPNLFVAKQTIEERINEVKMYADSILTELVE